MDAILNAPSPTSVTVLKSFLGLVSYYGKFIPNLSSTLYPLYQLLKHQPNGDGWRRKKKTFNLAKRLLLSNNVLIHFDPTLDLLLSCDASEYGIGAVLVHCLPDGSKLLIGFVSRTISEAECSYSQETLSCMFLESNNFTRTSLVASSP